MSKQLVEVLYAGEKDAKRELIDTLFTHLRVMAKLFRTPAEEPDASLDLRFVNACAPDFVLDAARLVHYKAQRAIIVLILTPEMVLNDRVMGSMDAILQCSDIRLIVVHAVAVPNPQALSIAKISWLPANKDTEFPVLKESTVHDRISELTAAVQNHIAQPHRQTQPPDRSGNQGYESQVPTVSPPQAKRRLAPPVSETRAPALAVFVADHDRAAVEPQLGPVLTLLQSRRNVRSYAQWLIPAGQNCILQRQLAEIADNVVVFLSAESIADDQIAGLLARISPRQKVVLVVLSACLWEIIDKPEQAVILPLKRGAVSTIPSVSDGWSQLSRQLLELFLTTLPDEESRAQTTAERDVIARYEERSRRDERPVVPLTDAELVRAYWNK